MSKENGQEPFYSCKKHFEPMRKELTNLHIIFGTDSIIRDDIKCDWCATIKSINRKIK